MITLSIIAVALAGAFVRLLYGGAPHVPTPEDPTKQLPGWLHKGPCDALFVLIGVGAFAAQLNTDWRQLLVYVVISVLIAFGWNPGHGSYLAPGDNSKDDEDIQPVVAGIAGVFGWTAGSVPYSCLGMGVRYGSVSIPAAALMGLAHHLLGMFPGWWIYAPVGVLAAPVMRLLVALHWDRGAFVQKPWLDPVFHNGPFELAIGALMYGFLPLTTVQL